MDNQLLAYLLSNWGIKIKIRNLTLSIIYTTPKVEKSILLQYSIKVSTV